MSSTSDSLYLIREQGVSISKQTVVWSRLSVIKFITLSHLQLRHLAIVWPLKRTGIATMYAKWGLNMVLDAILTTDKRHTRRNNYLSKGGKSYPHMNHDISWYIYFLHSQHPLVWSLPSTAVVGRNLTSNPWGICRDLRVIIIIINIKLNGYCFHLECLKVFKTKQQQKGLKIIRFQLLITTERQVCTEHL